MTDYINRLRRTDRSGRVSGDGRTEHCTDLPLDHRLTFSAGPGEKWTFDEERKIRLNDEDVGELIHEGANDIGLLCGLSQGLYDYQQHVWSKGGKEREKFNAQVFSLQATIHHRLGSIYDGLTGGVHFECKGSDFWINNVNICSVLNLYRLRPTDKARQYLCGLRDKLGLILSRRHSSTRYDGVMPKARELLDEINLVLELIPPDGPLLLSDGSRVS
jgi:hypothetical protein